jgi:hypothetical protein
LIMRNGKVEYRKLAASPGVSCICLSNQRLGLGLLGISPDRRYPTSGGFATSDCFGEKLNRPRIHRSCPMSDPCGTTGVTHLTLPRYVAGVRACAARYNTQQ